MSNKSSGGTVTVSFRIPADVHAALKREAERDRRSLNFVVVEALKRHASRKMTCTQDKNCLAHPYDDGSSVKPRGPQRKGKGPRR